MVELISAPSLAQLKLMKAPNGKRIEIIKTVAPRWLDIGDMLNFDAKGEKLKQIRKEEGNRGDEAICRKMFQLWLEGSGIKPILWATLLRILEDSDFTELAAQIKATLTQEFQCMCGIYLHSVIMILDVKTLGCSIPEHCKSGLAVLCKYQDALKYCSLYQCGTKIGNICVA